jgi:hypothetical protein
MAGWIEYDSNNSGGSFWLSDENWKALEEAGWVVGWTVVTEREGLRDGERFVHAESGRRYGDTWEEATREYVIGAPRWPDGKDPGRETIVACARNYDEAVALRKKHGGYFGTLAVSAVKRGESAQELVDEFERVTGQDASAEGCNCCGPPHSFEWHDDDGTTKYGHAIVTKTELAWS